MTTATAGPENRTRSPWIVVVVMTLGLFMTLLDLTIVNIAIPSIVTGLNAGLDQVLWMLNGYSLCYAVLLITSGRLGDVVGQRNLFVSGVLLFTAASAFSGLAQSPGQLIAGRALQGVGAAMLAPQTMPVFLTLFPLEKRAPVFALFGIVAGLAVVAGPTLGGLLVSDLGWRWIFFVNLPVGIAVMAAALRVVPGGSTGRRHRLDMVGVALISAGLLCVVFGLIEGQRYSWGTITGIISIPLVITVGVLFLAAFGVQQARGQGGEPLLPFALLRNRNFALMSLVLCGMGFMIVGFYLPLTIYYQSVLGLSAIAAGLTVAVQPGTMMLSSGGANSPAAMRLNPRILLVTGLVLLAAGAAFIAWVASADAGRWLFAPGLIVSGFGMGLIWGPLFNLATAELDPKLGGIASGVLNTVQELGAVIASASVGALLQTQLVSSMVSRAQQAATSLPPPYASRFVSAFANTHGSLDVGAGQSGTAIQLPPGVPANVAAQLQSLGHGVFTHGFVDAMRPTLILPIAVVLVAAVLASLVRVRRHAGMREPAAAA